MPSNKYPNAPFIFMRLRVLAYLSSSHTGVFPRGQLHDDFWIHFGIPSSVVDQTIRELETTNANRGALCESAAPS
jgi:hypothetical protein